jgi:hypothetical protein
MVDNLRLIRDFVDLSVFAHQDCRTTALNALFSAGGIILHSWLAGAVLVLNKTLELCSNTAGGKPETQRYQRSNLLHYCSPYHQQAPFGLAYYTWNRLQAEDDLD